MRYLTPLLLVILTFASCDDDGKSASPPTCDDGIACNGVETYDATSNACIPGTTPCQNTEFCDPVADNCVEQCPGCRIDGVCYGEGQANPTNPCLFCDTASPVAWSNQDGVPCDDGLFCTTDDTCLDGTCGGTPLDCDDGVFCNGLESCDEDLDTCVQGLTTCSATEVCDVQRDQCADWCPGCAIEGNCYGDGQINPTNPCQLCSLDATALAWTDNDGAPCDDGLFCTQNDICQGGTCDGTALTCDDGVACNGLETCDESAGGCVEGPGTCATYEVCDAMLDRCVVPCDGCVIGTICYGEGQVNPANQCEMCDTGRSLNTWSDRSGSACDDGLFCTQGDTCNGNTCEGSPRVCSDGIACNGIETCDESTDSCQDGTTTCQSHELCDMVGDQCVTPCDGCVIGTNCYGEGQINPANQCEICDTARAADAWSDRDGHACDDGLFCTQGDTCSLNTCQGSPRECSDGIACNGLETCDDITDSCQAGTTPCAPHELCDMVGDQCVTPCGGCVIGTNCYGEGQVNPANECEICDTALSTTAWSALDGMACDDGLFCTQGDTCVGTTCQGTTGWCNDGVVCNGLETCDEAADTCVDEVRSSCETFVTCTNECATLGESLDYFVSLYYPQSVPTAGGETVTLIGSFGDGAGATLLETVSGAIITPTLYTADKIEFIAPEGAYDMAFTLTEAGGITVPLITKSYSSSGEVTYSEEPTIPVTYYSPTITRVTGCMASLGNGTAECNINGGDTITLEGSNMGDDADALTIQVGSQVCTNPTVVLPHQPFSCTLLANSSGGYDLPVTLTVDSRTSTFTEAVSYMGPVLDDFDDLVDVSSTDGTSLTLTGFGFGSDISAVDVTFGPAEAPYHCAVVSVMETEIQCNVPPGIGIDYPVTVQVGDAKSRPSNSTISYAFPTVDGSSLRAEELGTGDATLVLSTLPAQVWFDVDNVGDNADLIAITYSDGTNLQECLDPVIAGTPGSQRIGCVVWTNHSDDYIPMGDVHFTLHVPGTASATPFGTLVFPSACSTLASISGCDDHGDTTTLCPTMGGPLLTVSGTGFTSETQVTLDGFPVPHNVINSNTLTFTLPEGVGYSMVQTHTPGCLTPPIQISYAPPEVIAVSGCPGSVDGATFDCPTEGGSTTIYIEGHNFGASGGQVLIGGEPCTDVVHMLNNPHETLSCILPPGTGADVPVTVINGHVSVTTGTLSYVQ